MEDNEIRGYQIIAGVILIYGIVQNTTPVNHAEWVEVTRSGS